MKQLLIAIVLILSMFAFAQEETAQVFEFNNKFGLVTFSHTTHQGYNSCEECHPAFPEAFSDDVSIKDVAHQLCKDCHKAANSPNAPVGCKDCHKKE